MELPVTDFNLRDLVRELYGRALNIEGTLQELQERLLTARHEKAEAQAQGFLRSGRPPITKFGACVQPDDFAEIEAMTDDEYLVFSRKVQWRLRRIIKTYTTREALEYYHPGVLHRIDRTKSYTLNVDEFWVRSEPYIHKMFVVFVCRTNSEEQRLCYARSLVKYRSKDMSVDQLRTPLMANHEIGRVLTSILLEIENNGLENYVAIVAAKNNHMKALEEVKMVTGQVLPQIIFDTCHLHKSFETMFCSKSANCLFRVEHEPYHKDTYMEQLSKYQTNYIQNVDAEGLLMEYLASVPDLLQAMWKVEEHKDKSISLARLNNERLNVYEAQVQSDLPPITFEECSAGGGLLQLILFDALWCLCDGYEIEENYAKPTLDTEVPVEWLPLLN